MIQMDVDDLLRKKMSFIGTVQKVFGVLGIIGGACWCIGIITAVIGIPYIFLGIKLFKSGSNFSYAAYSNDGKFLREAILNLASFWLINVVLIAAVIILYVIIIIFAIALGMSAGGGNGGYYY